MKILMTFALIVCIAASSFAQSKASSSQNTFNKGDIVVNLGVGFGSALYSGSVYTSRTPSISGSFEMGVVDNVFDDKSSLGAGGYLGYTGAKTVVSGSGVKYSSIIIGPRAALHYQLIDNLDTYAGLMLGYNNFNSSVVGNGWSGAATASGGLTSSWFVGGRYHFDDRFAGLVEIGYGVAYINLGVAIKL